MSDIYLTPITRNYLQDYSKLCRTSHQLQQIIARLDALGIKDYRLKNIHSIDSSYALPTCNVTIKSVW